LWGNDILVSPVVKSGLQAQEVTFPKGSNWFNFYTDEKVEGGQTKTVQLSTESIPTYIRGGAFIPMIKTIQNTSKYSLNNFDLHFYFDETVIESEGKLYNDDGETPNAFEKENYEIINFESEYKKNCLTVEFETELGKNYTFSSKEITLIIHNISKKPKKVKGYKFTWNKEKSTLIIPVSMHKISEKTLKIKF
jgi:alpha-glucosidase (family GH31 glycosyl hydrolase)